MRKKIKIGLLALLTVGLLTSGAIISASAEEEFVFNSKEQVLETYNRGFVLTVPTVTFSKGDETYETNSKLIFPDGRISVANRIKLDVPGEYTLLYTGLGADTDKSFTFTVKNTTASLFNAVEGVAKCSPAVVHMQSGYTGTKITVAQSNTTLEFSKVIDLEDLDALTPVIDFMLDPTMVGSMEMSSVEVVLTDFYDENNTVTIQATPHIESYRDRAYITASANGNTFLGKINPTDTQPNTWGTPVAHCFYGEEQTDGWFSIKYYFDVSTMRIYASPYAGASREKVLVIDLDEPNDHLDVNRLFTGFTSNEVIVSLRFPALTAKEGNIIVNSVGGVSLSESDYADKTAPTIKVDFGSFVYNENDPAASTIPYGVVGKSYKVFDAYSYDDADGVYFSVDVEVYGADGQRQKLTEGRFIPNAVGEYVILYKKTDSSGNTAYKRVTVTVKSAYEQPLSITLNDTYNGEEKQVADLVYLSEGTTIGGSGGSGYELSVWLGTQRILVEGEFGRRYFIPEKAGVYTIRYTLSDYLSADTVLEDTVTVVAFDNAIIDVQTLYPTYQVGIVYPLPIAENLVCRNGELLREYVYATVDGARKVGETQFCADTAGELIFSFGSGDSVVQKTVPVIDVSTTSGDYLTRFFTGSNIEITARDYGIDFVTETENNEFTFINALPVDMLSFDFQGIKDAGSFDSLIFEISDSMYKEQTIEIELRRAYASGKEFSWVYVNGKQGIRIEKAFDGAWLFSFAVKNGKLYADGEVIKTFDFWKNGEVFNGFSSGKILLKGRFSGVSGRSGVQLKTIINQNLSNVSRDRVAPAIVIGAEYSSTSYKFLGDIMSVYTAQATDVLKGDMPVSVSLMKPDGTVVEYGKADEVRTVTAEEYGEYTVIYSTTDGNNAISVSYTYVVRDIVAPTMSFKGSISKTIKKGEKVKLATGTATDDTGDDLAVYCYVLRPDGVRTVVENGGSYTFAIAGRYRIVYYANDMYFNLVETSVFVEVK